LLFPLLDCKFLSYNFFLLGFIHYIEGIPSDNSD
jgi:hypothetical protein